MSQEDKKLILVVDDNSDNRTLLKDIVEGMCGAEVIEAANASEALTKLSNESRNIDGVVADLSMPEIDGFSLLAMIQEMMPNIPIAMLVTTSYMSGERDYLPTDVKIPEFLNRSQIMGKDEPMKIAQRLNELLKNLMTGK